MLLLGAEEGVVVDAKEELESAVGEVPTEEMAFRRKVLYASTEDESFRITKKELKTPYFNISYVVLLLSFFVSISYYSFPDLGIC